MQTLMRAVLGLSLLLPPFAVAGSASPLPADEVFRLNVSRDPTGLKLVWAIAPGTYLYRAMLEAKDVTGATIPIQTPSGEMKDDPDFGPQQIYRETLQAGIAAADIQDRRKIVVIYQGCAETFQLCYPPVSKAIDLQTLAVADPVAAIPPKQRQSSEDAPFEDAPSASEPSQ